MGVYIQYDKIHPGDLLVARDESLLLVIAILVDNRERSRKLICLSDTNVQEWYLGQYDSIYLVSRLA
jgi:hypothetical protein